ncbi:MAG: major capsid protein [Methylicorpusculum sp.]|uniref:major capsid protein n=1 Tax=Methylicorpusculum sp. TaxID=2713644 RepID=UPI002721EC97|nr:major capsid protein [Methylicorpusculum sp.]MDO8940899.1 major capsid protein [Methylicorpusculum sp.]MDP2202410.1 major capsid protein [Methylicorpusculum sp.]
MAKTLISDILKPENWNKYGINRTAELSALFQSGIVATVPDIILPNGGGTVNLPYFNDLTGDAENLSDSAALTVGNITSSKDVAAVIGRGRAFSVNDLAAVFSGADPAMAIIDLLAAYWARQMQKELIGTLGGAFAAASMSGNVLDVSAGGTEVLRAINENTFIDATQLLGDAKDGISAVAMHSATEAYLAKKQMIVYETTADKNVRIPTYLGKRVIVDDGLPVTTGTYTTYIFAPGAVGFAEATIGEDDLETDRDILAGDTVMTMRRRFMLHPRGIKWKGTPAAAFPSRAELAIGTNWERVFENKQIRIVQFKHKNA